MVDKNQLYTASTLGECANHLARCGFDFEVFAQGEIRIRTKDYPQVNYWPDTLEWKALRKDRWVRGTGSIHALVRYLRERRVAS